MTAGTPLRLHLSPVGGYKGYGLSLCVDLLTGLLSGAAYLTHVKSWVDEPDERQNLGHVFILIDTTRVMPTDALAERMTDFAGIIHATIPVEDSAPVILPGERELKRLALARRNGISLNGRVLSKIRNLLAAGN